MGSARVKGLLNISQGSVIYIVSPFIQTGGPHSLHQLAFFLRKHGCNVAMVYYPKPFGKSYKKSLYPAYALPVAEKIDDKSNNIMVVPETSTEMLSKFANIQKCIWWLSLDFHFFEQIFEGAKASLRTHRIHSSLLPLMIGYKIVSKLYKREALVWNSSKNYVQANNLYNCEYVRGHLQKEGIDNEKMHYLCGPLEDKYLCVCKEEIFVGKEEIIIYSPKKMDMSFFRKVKDAIIERDKSIRFVPLQNMNREQIFHIEQKAKLYLDFGFFPGPERIPRESVSLYCNIITSNIGAAGNDIDVCIPKEYKFNLTDENVDKIADLSVDMIHNYGRYVDDFEPYREKVKEQINRFDDDIREIFGLNKNKGMIS